MMSNILIAATVV